jgi:hypothetical protein
MSHTERTALTSADIGTDHDHAWRLVLDRRPSPGSSKLEIYRCDVCRLTWTD